MTRTWGFWTEHKLSMLAAYLPAFTTASQRSPRTLYLDLFAGGDRNFSRTTGEPISGSPRVALSTQPPFTKLVFFELPAQAAKLQTELRADFPHWDFDVVPGDCNTTLGPTLQRLRDYDRAPTFAFVDQHAAEVRWSTLEQLSRFKRPGFSKVELWLLFAPSMLPRGLGGDDTDNIERFAARITAMYGSEEWREAYAARRRGLLTPTDLRDELLNLMRWRIEKLLGYEMTHSFGMKNTKGSLVYNLVFATDNKAGEKIMRHIYAKAAEAQPRMRAEAVAKLEAQKEEKSGRPGLFAPMVRAVKQAPAYEHEPPWPPYRLRPHR